MSPPASTSDARFRWEIRSTHTHTHICLPTQGWWVQWQKFNCLCSLLHTSKQTHNNNIFLLLSTSTRERVRQSADDSIYTYNKEAKSNPRDTQTHTHTQRSKKKQHTVPKIATLFTKSWQETHEAEAIAFGVNPLMRHLLQPQLPLPRERIPFPSKMTIQTANHHQHPPPPLRPKPRSCCKYSNNSIGTEGICCIMPLPNQI